MNDFNRTRRLIDSSTGCFCVLAIFALRMCLGLWSRAPLGTRIYMAGALCVCLLGPVINHQLKKGLLESV